LPPRLLGSSPRLLRRSPGTFVFCLALGNLLFSFGLIYDYLLIVETLADADKTPGPGADILLARLRWRWTALGVLVVATLLIVPGTVLYVQALGVGASAVLYPSRHGTLPARLLWQGDAYFAISTALFVVGYALQAGDVVLTLDEVAELQGKPQPRWDEVHVILALIGGGLLFLTLGLSAQVIFAPSLALEAAVGLACTTAILAMSIGVVWLLITQLREFAAGEDESQAGAVGEVTALLERNGE